MADQLRSPLKIAIIGAGIAGLSACIALRRAGHDVELLEKSSFRSEIGAAMTVTPNGNLILEKWGFDYVKAGATDKVQNRQLAFDTIELQGLHTYKHIPKKYGQFNAFHRVDLHNELRRLAESSDLPGSVSFKLGVDVQEIDCEAGILTLKDGSKIHKDLIVVADGIKSRFVKDINGEDVPRNFTGMSVHRTLIDMDALLQNPVTGPIFEGQDSGFVHTVDPNTGIMIVTYPCRADKVMNYAIFHRSKPSEKSGDDWNAPADIEDVLTLLDGFHPFWVELTKAADADSWKCFPVSKRDPLETIVRGRAVIIGDAAHACLPTHGQGGSMAIEDAAALGIVYAGSGPDEVAERLKLYEQLRLPRSATTQLISNGMMYYGSGVDVVDRIRKYYDGDLPTGQQLFSAPICSFFFPYDVFKQGDIAMKYLHQPGGVPKESMEYFGAIEVAA